MFAAFPFQKDHLAVLETQMVLALKFLKIQLQIPDGNIKFYHAKKISTTPVFRNN